MGLLNWFSKADTEQRASYNGDATVMVDGAVALDSLFATDTVTEDKLLKIPTAKACVDIVSSSIAQMPVYLYKENTDGSVEKVADKRVKLLNHEANDFLNGYNLKRNMVKDFVLHGASYVAKIEAGNTILELHPIPAQSVVVQKRVQNGYRTVGAEIVVSTAEAGALNQQKQREVKFKHYELMIATRESHDGLSGKGVLTHGQDIFKQAIAELDYTNNLYERGALPLGLLKTNARMNETQVSTLREAWAKLYSGIKNSAKTVVLQEGMEYQALSMNPNEIQMNDTKKATAAEICKLFNVPESMVSSTVGKQYVSIEQNNLHYLKNTLAPIIVAIEAAMDRALLLESEKEDGYFFRFDTAELVRSTEKERVDTLVAGVQGGLYTINEARAKLDLPAIEGADVTLVTPGAETTGEEDSQEEDQSNDETGTETN